MIKGSITKAGFRAILMQISQILGLSYPEISQKTGVHFTTIYNILRESKGDEKKNVHVGTIKRVAAGLGFDASIQSSGEVIFTRITGKRSGKENSLEQFSHELVQLIKSMRIEELSPQDKRKIKDVVRVLLRK